jgi:hypothetical protein
MSSCTPHAQLLSGRGILSGGDGIYQNTLARPDSYSVLRSAGGTARLIRPTEDGRAPPGPRMLLRRQDRTGGQQVHLRGSRTQPSVLSWASMRLARTR